MNIINRIRGFAADVLRRRSLQDENPAVSESPVSEAAHGDAEVRPAADRAPREAAAVQEPEVNPADFIGKRILLVEDNDMNREIAEDILTEAGFVVETAENGQLALELVLRNPEDYYDYILMDILMPVMDGLEAASAIREQVTGRHIPIVAISANAFEEDRLQSLAHGMDEHMGKPIEIRRLLKVLSGLTEK